MAHRRIATAALAAITIAIGVPNAAASRDDAATVRLGISAARRTHGLPTLGTHAALADIARRHAMRMRREGTIFHNDDIAADMDDTRIGWRIVGENVGAGPDVTDIEAAFMASPS